MISVFAPCGECAGRFRFLRNGISTLARVPGVRPREARPGLVAIAVPTPEDGERVSGNLLPRDPAQGSLSAFAGVAGDARQPLISQCHTRFRKLRREFVSYSEVGKYKLEMAVLEIHFLSGSRLNPMCGSGSLVFAALALRFRRFWRGWRVGLRESRSCPIIRNWRLGICLLFTIMLLNWRPGVPARLRSSLFLRSRRLQADFSVVQRRGIIAAD